MNRRMRKIFTIGALTGLMLLLILLPPGKTRAQGDPAAVVIQTINQLRAERGLAALEPHSALMTIAQQHSSYQASIGTWTHQGPDGSRPKDRAEAAGFGNGAAIYISENVAYGLNMSIMETINGPWNDPLHHHTMYNPSARFIGAGVAYQGNYVYYTVDTGYWAGDPAPPGESPAIASSVTPFATGEPTPVPVVKATPYSDGSIFHIIQQGQTLWTIAAVYEITLEKLLEINQLPADPILLPGDEILIQPSYTPTATPIGKPSPTIIPRYTHTPSPVSQEAGGIAVTLIPPTEPTGNLPVTPSFQSTSKQPVVIIMAVLIAGGTILLILVLSVRKGEPDE